MKKLTCLLLLICTAAGAEIRSLSGLQNLVGLAQLDIGSNAVSELSPISGLTGLTTGYYELDDMLCGMNGGDQVCGAAPLQFVTWNATYDLRYGAQTRPFVGQLIQGV